MAAPADVDADADTDATGETVSARPRRVRVDIDLDRDTAVPLAAGVLVALHLVLRLWTAAGGWFTPLDLAGVAAAVAGTGEVAGPPGAEALTRALASLAPLSWPAAVGLELLAQLAVDVLLYRLLVTLFGRRPAVLLPLAVYLASTLTLVGGVWWAAATVQLPVQLALVVALRCHVRYLRTGGRGPAVAAAVAVAAGALFSGGVLLVPLLLVALTLLWWTEGPLRSRARALAQWRTAWALQALAVVIGAGLRALLHTGPVPDPAFLADAAPDLPGLVSRTVLPGLVGGPWAWAPAGASLAVPAPPPAVVWAAAVAVGLTVVASVVLSRGALRAWLVAVVATVVALVATPASGVRAEIGDPPAATVAPAALALVAALATGLAFLPVRHAPAVLRRRGGSAGARLASWAARPAVGATVVALLAVSSLMSTTAFARAWSDDAARGWVETAQAELAARPDVVLADTTVPSDVVPNALAPANAASAVLAGLPVPARFLGEATVVPGLAVLDDEGRIQLGFVSPVARSGSGPVEGCGWAAGPEPVDVPLDGATTDGRWYLQLSYFAGADSTVWLTAGETRAGTLLASGLHDLFVLVTGEVDRVRVEVGDPGTTVCVGAVRVGPARPLPPQDR
jgi:hypothetical protein